MDPVTQKRNAYAQTKRTVEPKNVEPNYEIIAREYNVRDGSQLHKIRYGNAEAQVTVAMKANGDMPSEQEVITAINFFNSLNIDELNITKGKK